MILLKKLLKNFCEKILWRSGSHLQRTEFGVDLNHSLALVNFNGIFYRCGTYIHRPTYVQLEFDSAALTK